MLHSEPSFSIYNENQDSDMEKLVKSDEQLERSPTIGDRIDDLGSGEFSFGKKGMGLIQEDGNEEDDDDTKDFDENGEVGERYRRMLREQPSNPLLLSDYAQFLQSQGDLPGAEEYYFRATMADPKDGEILMQYAKLVWQLHHDKDKALSYFERAVSVAPQDSDVLAAYASFLWEIDESEEEDTLKNIETQIEENGGEAVLQNTGLEKQERPVSPRLHLAAGLGIDAVGLGVGISNAATTSLEEAGDVGEYHKRMVEENPCNPLFLRDYAEYLLKTKGDIQGAEEYYSRAILADSSNGETISDYAKLVWQFYHDKDKASSYFEQAVQASPESSDVLAAYARFLWEAEDDEGDDTIQN